MSAFIVTETGVVAEYPTANSIRWETYNDTYAVLYTASPENGGKFVVRVPKGCLVSFERPGVIQQASDAKRSTLENALEIICACIENIETNWYNVKKIKALKATLQRYDSRRNRWKR